MAMDFNSPSRYGGSGGFSSSQGVHESPSTYNSSGSGMGMGMGFGERKKRDLQSLTPVTVRQMLSGDLGEKLILDGKEMGQLELVGHLSAMEYNRNIASGTFHDLTGIIPLSMYLTDDGDELNVLKRQEIDELAKYKYVKVYGILKNLQDEKKLWATAIRPILDMNAVTYHALSVLQTHLRNTKGPLPAASNQNSQRSTGGNALNSSAGGPAFSSAQAAASSSMDSYSHPGMSNQMSFNSGQNDNFTALQQEILNAVQTNTHDDTGCHIRDVFNRLQGRFPLVEIQTQMTYLTDEGHLFTTIDESHVKRTGTA